MIPDPPGFSACAARLRATATTGAKRTNVQLKAECAQHLSQVREHVLTVLITFQWLAQESAAQGIKVSDSEVRKAFAQFRGEEFKSPAEYQRFLAWTGQSLADEWLRERMDLYGEKLLEKLGKVGTGQSSFLARFPREWRAKTSCAAELVVANCKEYTGPEAPEARI